MGSSDSPVWDPHENISIHTLEKVNTAAARFIANNYTYTPGSATRIKKQIPLDHLALRRKTHRLTLMHKITNNHIDINKQEYLHHADTTSTRNTHIHKYHTYGASTNAYKHSFFPRTIRDWNILPQHIIGANTSDTLKKLTLTHLGSRT